MRDMDELLPEFLAEAEDHLDILTRDLPGLALGPTGPARLDALLRALHTLKGAASLFAAPRLAALAHACEEPLAHRRDQAGALTPESLHTILQAVARMSELCRTMRVAGAEPAGCDRDLIRALGAGDVLEPAQAPSSFEPQREDASAPLPTAHVAWRPLRLVVREAEAALGKRVALVLEDEVGPFDRRTAARLQAALVHLVRNACDHGIESPAARRAAGKPETGLIRLSVRREGPSIVLDLSDDGAGLDAARIRSAAIAKGLMSPERAAALSDEDAYGLIFRPGLSTAPAPTRWSGRGVGMDVVKANVEELGGRVELSSRPGAGSAIRMILPAEAIGARTLEVAA